MCQPSWSLLLLLAPIACYRLDCDWLAICIAVAVIGAAGLYVVLAIVRELQLLGRRNGD